MDNQKIEQLMAATGMGRRAARTNLCYLQIRYGNRKAVKTLLKMAVLEIVGMQTQSGLNKLAKQ